MGMHANLHCGDYCTAATTKLSSGRTALDVRSSPFPGDASNVVTIFATTGQVAGIALAILSDEVIRDALADDQWEQLSQLVRGHDVAEMADAHVAECPECQAWYDQRDAAMAEDDEYERRLTRCNKAAVIGLDGPIGCRLASEHAGPCVPQHGLTTGTAS